MAGCMAQFSVRFKNIIRHDIIWPTSVEIRGYKSSVQMSLQQLRQFRNNLSG